MWTKTYTVEELTAAVEAATADDVETIRRRQDGRWYFPGADTAVGVRNATYHRNHSY